MEPSIYLIKVNVALIVLYAFYKFSFSKDTFFSMGHRTKRFFQWSGKMGERF